MKLGLQIMINKRNGLIEILVGGVVFFIALVFIIYAISTTTLNKHFSESAFSVEASFQSVEGIQIGSDVLLAGVKVGSVSRIRLNKKTFQAIITLSLFENYQLPEDTEAVIASDGLLGGKFVLLNVGGSDIILNNGDELLYTQSSMDILNLLNRFISK